jgi:hypothetical protein
VILLNMSTGHRVALALRFEAAVLLRCTSITASRYPRLRHPVSRPPAVFAEFRDDRPANRLAELLAAGTVEATRVDLTAGGHRQHRLHRVVVPAEQAEALRRLFDAAWTTGRHELLAGLPVGPTLPRQAVRWALATAAWRAALLAAGRRCRPDYLGIRVSDPDTAAVLVRSARVLDVPVSARSTGGCTLLAVSVQDRLPEQVRVAAERPASSSRRPAAMASA